ncbi:hypothetical protein D1094_17695, partial [Colwellia sp. RSH04]
RFRVWLKNHGLVSRVAGYFLLLRLGFQILKVLVFVGSFPLPSNNKRIQIGHVTVGHRFAIIANVTLPFNINVRFWLLIGDRECLR